MLGKRDTAEEEHQTEHHRHETVDLLAREERQQMLQRHHQDRGQRLHPVLIGIEGRQRPALAVHRVAAEDDLLTVGLVAFQREDADTHPQDKHRQQDDIEIVFYCCKDLIHDAVLVMIHLRDVSSGSSRRWLSGSAT